MASSRIITLTTDFGVADHFVGTMKGVILGIFPEAKIVDLCNSVGSFDVLDGAMTLAQAYSYYPPDTIHLVVVDPGVGSARRPLLVATSRHYFMAPDNGVLSLVMEKEERIAVRHITSEHYFLQPVSNTFHGRDVFAPCAAWMAKGVEPEKFGEEITDYVRFAIPKPKQVAERAVKGVVLKTDRFGNLITNFTPENAPYVFADGAQVKISVGQAVAAYLSTNYAQGKPGECFAMLNSMGYLEIACNRGSASHLAHAGRGAEVTVEF
ncbi:MAG: SAM-dependent chlorinase/fluorinase [Acidobacteriota bacterium]|nr:SAM-dependent chlorinase/fluorinase [Acidobacteriota bacterium]